MTEPQLIFLDKGEFRPGRVVPYTESHYVGLDIRGNCVLEGERMNPLSLHLVYAAPLSPHLLSQTVFKNINYSILQFENSFLHERYITRAVNIGAVVKKVVKEAQHLAKDSGVPYFSVSAAITHLDDEPSDLDRKVDEFNPSKNMGLHFIRKPDDDGTKKTKFILHPTAQLYVMR